VEVHDPVPYADALQLQASADVLLLLQWDDPADEGNVPGKVFEYLAVRRPILGLGPENGIPARLIRERAAGLFANDPDVIAGQLSRWTEEKRACGHVPRLPVEVTRGLTRDEQYMALDRYLPDRLGRHPKPCSSADPQSTRGHVRRVNSGERSCRTPARRPMPTALAVLVDLGAWLSSRLRPPAWSVCSRQAATGGPRRRSIRPKIAAKRARGTATSASWNTR
jgi:hypothetical protein